MNLFAGRVFEVVAMKLSERRSVCFTAACGHNKSVVEL